MGINQRNRALLEQLHRHGRGVFGPAEAALALDMGRDEASRLLVYLARRGWLSRVRRGLYVAVPLGAGAPDEWAGDPFVVADRVFSPCYIGGWSAAAHWRLTEQVSQAVLVVTARRVRERHLKLQGTPYRLTVRGEDALFGTVPVWRGENRVQVSDPSRTVVDTLDEPRLGGGIRTVAEVVHRYLQSEHRHDRLLVEYGDRLDNRAIFKRLGYVLEHSGVDAPELVRACLERRSSGLVSLDPSVKTSGRIVRRWRLRVNVTLGSAPGGR